MVKLTINPYIFIGRAIFSIITVFISCKIPTKNASKVSPIEAVRYNEQPVNKKRRKRKKATPFNMAIANLTRNRMKMIIVTLSISLSICILQMTVTFTNSFDMDKYLKKYSVSDFLIGNSKYINNSEFFNKKIALTDEDIQVLSSVDGVENIGVVYGKINIIEDASNKEKKPITIYAMDKYARSKIRVISGSVDNGIVAVYPEDDYFNVDYEYNKTQIGDMMTVRFVDKWKVVSRLDGTYNKPIHYTDEKYNTVGIATVQHNMGYRYMILGQREYIVPYEMLGVHTNQFAPMNILLDVEDEKIKKVENYLTNYIDNINQNLQFESQERHILEFYKFKNMFLILGVLLSSIIAFIGILNFFNVIITSINTRKREFAILQSVGMTGKQLKSMLIYESMIYIVVSIVFAIVLILVITPMFVSIISDIFWFFTSNNTIMPIIIAIPIFVLIGIYTPIIVYKITQKYSIIEKIRQN